MSLNKSATIRHALLGASSLAIAAFTFAPQASAQVAPPPERPQVTFPASGNFANLTPSAGNDTITVATDNALYLPLWGNFGSAPQEGVTKDFLGGTNVVNNNGYVFVGVEHGGVLFEGARSGAAPFQRDNTRYEGHMRMENLTTFNNNGDIYLGAFYSTTTSVGIGLVGTDRWADDILSMPGANFVGGDDSRVFLDVDFNATAPQTACNPAQRITTPVAGDNGSNSLPVADCIDLTGGSASGRTALFIHDIYPGDRGAYNPDGAVIIDMAGGDDINPNAFFVGGSPNATFDERNGGGIDKGLFLYTLGYDSEAQQFRLYGIQSAAAHQFPLLAHAASDLWRTTSGGWFERQVDQRDSDSRGGGVWGRVAVSEADRGVTAFGQAGDKLVTFDNSYAQEDTAVTFGADVIVAEGRGDAWAVGAMIGYARSRVDFNQSVNTANLEGMHAGLYSAFTAGAFFVDAAVNGTWLDLDNDVPAMDLTPAGTILGTKVQSLGGRLEAGWRFGNDRFSVEPLAGLSVVRTSFDDLNVPADDPARIGGDVAFDDATSRRASAGVRLSISDVVPLTPTNRISLTARHGAEFDGEASASIANIGPDAAPVSDTFDGQFSELAATLTAANAAETVAGYLNFGVLFGDDYDRLSASAGLRFQW